MVADRYVKCVLTVIAIELAWLGAREFAVPVAAQATATATPVIITGIRLNDADGSHLPVVVVGSARQIPTGLAATVDRLTTRLATTVQIDTRQPLKVEIDRPVKVEADKPLKVDQVPYTPGLRPGE